MKIEREKDTVLNTWIWKADFTHKKKRHRISAFSKADLEDQIIAIKSANKKQTPNTTLQQLFDAHIKGFDLTKKSHRRGKVILLNFLQHVGSTMLVTDLGTADVRSYINKRKAASPLKPESVNKEVGFISVMLRDAGNCFKELADYIPPKMPWASVPQNTTQRVIYKEERETLLSYLRTEDLHPNEKPTSRLARFEYADMFEIAYNTAMRWGETHQIEWSMIDWRKKEIHLPSHITKTKSGRTSYLNSRAIEILKRRKKDSASKYVFPGIAPDRPRKYYYEGIRRICKKLKLPFGQEVGFTLHSSKHTALTNVIESTGDIAAAQKLGGHTSRTMTLKYTHTTRQRMLDAVEQLPEK